MVAVLDMRCKLGYTALSLRDSGFSLVDGFLLRGTVLGLGFTGFTWFTPFASNAPFIFSYNSLPRQSTIDLSDGEFSDSFWSPFLLMTVS
jgi:hypothetical protein